MGVFRVETEAINCLKSRVDWNLILGPRNRIYGGYKILLKGFENRGREMIGVKRRGEDSSAFSSL